MQAPIFIEFLAARTSVVVGPKQPSCCYGIGQMANFSTITSDSKIVENVR